MIGSVAATLRQARFDTQVQRSTHQSIAYIILILSLTTSIPTSSALAQSSASSINLEGIAAACSGLQTATASGGRGKISSTEGYAFEVTPDNELRITQSGQLVSKIDNFTYSEYTKCVSDLAVALTRSPPGAKSCRIPSNGVERFGNEFDTTQESGWRGGGYNQGAWCESFIANLRSQHQAAGSIFQIMRKSERSESKCSPFNCPQYNYSCTVHVKTDPVYILKDSPDCP